MGAIVQFRSHRRPMFNILIRSGDILDRNINSEVVRRRTRACTFLLPPFSGNLPSFWTYIFKLAYTCFRSSAKFHGDRPRQQSGDFALKRGRKRKTSGVKHKSENGKRLLSLDFQTLCAYTGWAYLQLNFTDNSIDRIHHWLSMSCDGVSLHGALPS